ncbi:MAG: amino acid ABC transporter permease [Gemmobacter sp.]|jgi:polar amino acid transport system permease protein|nr:amino acid ABC transporter permease [Gemmobacter sp.]
MTGADAAHIAMGIPMTLGLTAGAFAIGSVLGFPVMLARSTGFLPLRVAVIAVIAFVRALPPILWVFLIYFGLGSGLLNLSPFVAALSAFGLIAAVNMAEIYRGGMLSISSGQWEAARALNLSRVSTWTDIMIPQMTRVALPPSATYVIGLMKDSAIASTIGVTELAYRGKQMSQITFEGLSAFAVVGVCYIALSLPVAWIARTAEKKLRAKVAR